MHTGTTIRSSHERGTVLVLALFFVVFAVGLIMAGSESMRANRDKTSVGLNVNGHANQFARAGLIEAIRWFRRQPTQPVVAFCPQLDMAATPPVRETMDPDIGLVREFRVDGNVWGRYEVWKEWEADPDATRLEFRRRVQCEDMSDGRDMSAAGGTWRLRCIAYLYDRRDDGVSFNQRPNRVLGTQVLETEISRLFIKPPGQAAINAGDPNDVEILENVKILGGSDAVGVYYRDVTSDPRRDLGGLLAIIEPTINLDIRGVVSGTSNLVRATLYEDTPKQVFGVKAEELRSMASTFVTDRTNLPKDHLLGVVVARVDELVFDTQRPLLGKGVLFVDGDLTIQRGSNSFYNGMIYVTGDLHIESPAEIRGTIVGRGDIYMKGHGDYVVIEYDDAVVTAVTRDIGTYRVSRAIRRAIISPGAAASVAAVPPK